MPLPQLNRTRFACVVSVLCLSVASFALERAEPESIGLSPEKLERITEYLQKEVDEGRIPGAVGLIARHGKVGYLQAVGKSDLNSGEAMNEDSLFRIASMTKAITAAAVMSLVEEGKLSLDDPVSKYLPEFADIRVIKELEGDSMDTVESARPVTIHHLMAHTSGMHYGWFGPGKLTESYKEKGVKDMLVPIDESTGERVARFAKSPLKFHPGDSWQYSFSSDVLGSVIEKASGLSLDRFFYERFFRPLQMMDTHFYVPGSKQERMASVYTIDAEQRLVEVGSEAVATDFFDFTNDYCFEGKGRYESGGAGLVSSTMDYARFMQMLLSKGRLGDVQVLDSGSVDAMASNQIGDLTIPFEGHGERYGYGIGVLTQDGKAKDIASVGSYSWGGIFNTYFWVDPQEELIGIVMTQIFPYFHLTLREDFKRLTYDAIDDSGFARLHWYEKGDEHANPFFNGRQLRVNAAEVSTHPTFASRSEPRSSGMARIRLDADLRTIRRADLYSEIWGGHPGTADKRVVVNGRSRFDFPKVGVEEKHCAHQYVNFNLRAIDLVNGYNSLQFACGTGNTFWGHYIVDNACIKVGLHDSDESLVAGGLSGFEVAPKVEARSGDELVRVSLDATPDQMKRIKSVVYQAHYYGYDENGDGLESDWHGMTKDRAAYGMLGEVEKAPFALEWDTRFVPAQPSVRVRAFVTFKGDELRDLVYHTPNSAVFEIAPRNDVEVSLHGVSEMDRPFWSRADNLKTATIELGYDPSEIESAQLQVVSWAGGPGEVEEYFTLNDQFFPASEGHGHDLQYHVFDVDPKLLKQGANRLELLSDTEYHGIEIMLPGPALVLRKRK